MAETDDPRRNLPGVDAVLLQEALRPYVSAIRQDVLVGIIREEIADARDRVEKGRPASTAAEISLAAARRIERLTSPSLRRVINATGVILHTGLGRASLSSSARDAIQTAAGYCNLELNLETGERGDRQTHLRELLCRFTGAEGALVVNNNAAAVYLTLNTLAFRREVVVSRGQLIEIGGSFRLPDIMKRAGVKLVEVGTTNRTRIADFSDAVTEQTALLLRAYPSNYRIAGFTESVSIADLASLAAETDTILVDDLGGGLLWDWTDINLPYEPNVRESLEAGADLVLVSGDKVLGGPQAGIILGKSALVRKLARSPLARVLRADKLTVSALSATLREYLYSSEYRTLIPTWRTFSTALDELNSTAHKLIGMLSKLGEWSTLDVVSSSAEAGSGTLPAMPIPSVAVRCLPDGWTCSRWAKALRTASTPVLGTIRDDLLCLDMRTVQSDELPIVVNSIRESLSKGRS